MIDKFINYKKICPSCKSNLIYRSYFSTYRKITPFNKHVELSIVFPDTTREIIKIDNSTNEITRVALITKNNYCTGHFYAKCNDCMNYEYRSNFIIYNNSMTIFPETHVEVECLFSNEFVITNLYTYKSSIIDFYDHNLKISRNLTLPLLPTSIFELDSLELSEYIEKISTLL